MIQSPWGPAKKVSEFDALKSAQSDAAALKKKEPPPGTAANVMRILR
jgi:hypothetical protein